MSRWLRFRSVADRVVALFALMAVAPAIVALAIAVRIADHGQAFLAVPRIGRNGETFRMWKLRSMRIEQSDGRARGVSLTAAEDDRITPIGRWMRAYYLDELPQLWNVVRGEMCLLSARPEAPEFVDMNDRRWALVVSASPGVAGPTQLIVNDWEREVITLDPTGADYVDVVLPVKLAIDGWYVRNASLRLDLLVARTLVRRLLSRPRLPELTRLIRNEVPESIAAEARPLHDR